MSDQSFLIFSGTSNEKFAQETANCLGMQLGKIAIETFPDKEIGVQIQENVRGRDVFVMQSVARHPNLYLMELLIIVDALKRASARSIVAVLPYFPYARQDRKGNGRMPITARLVANLLEKAGVTSVLTMDLHTEQIQGFFDILVSLLTFLRVDRRACTHGRFTALIDPNMYNLYCLLNKSWQTLSFFFWELS